MCELNYRLANGYIHNKCHSVCNSVTTVYTSLMSRTKVIYTLGLLNRMNKWYLYNLMI